LVTSLTAGHLPPRQLIQGGLDCVLAEEPPAAGYQVWDFPPIGQTPQIPRWQMQPNRQTRN